MDVGWPMLAQLLSYPVAVSTQRYVLAQWGTHQDVAEYGVAGQVFFALNGLVVAAGLALWPMYARRRHRGELRRGPFLLAGIFAAGVGAATVFVALVGPWVFDFITDGTLEVRTTTILAFGLMVTCTAGLYPLGMFIMDKPGIRFQVVPTLLMALASLALSIVLTPAIGTAGPPLGNAVAVVVFQVIPFSWYIIRHRARLLGSETASAPEEPQPEDGAGTDANSETAASHS
jgi:O-antigen/teichoic acid export membrane protein